MAGQLSAGALISADVFGLGWRWAFLPIVPIGFVLWFFAAKLLPHTPPGVAGRLDITGAAVLGVVSFLVMFPLIQGRNAGWPIWIFVMLACWAPTVLTMFWPGFLPVPRARLSATSWPKEHLAACFWATKAKSSS
jgi:hypothetical protein